MILRIVLSLYYSWLAIVGGRLFVVYDSLKVGGVLYVVGVFQFFVFELVAETLYPGYSVSNNYISDLGATCTTSCIVHQPSATIFDTTVFFLGLMLLVGTFFVYHGTRKKPYFIASSVASIATLLVGVFPENTGLVHETVSEIAFFLAGISLVLAWTILKKGGIFRYLAVALGVLTLFFSVFDPSKVVGAGGAERLIVLPALLGILALGGYLSGQDSALLVAKQQKATAQDAS